MIPVLLVLGWLGLVVFAVSLARAAGRPTPLPGPRDAENGREGVRG